MGGRSTLGKAKGGEDDGGGTRRARTEGRRARGGPPALFRGLQSSRCRRRRLRPIPSPESLFNSSLRVLVVSPTPRRSEADASGPALLQLYPRLKLHPVRRVSPCRSSWLRPVSPIAT
ncbi:hypothetical protein BHE74_00058997 [Ensete ventricosum]|nr:hypothetical protein BHE74_00058997 [Ensete ventricosum]